MNTLDNELKLYFGDDYKINEYITLHHPTIGDIVDVGEDEYFSTVYTMAGIPSDMKPQLWDIGICWEDISDFDYFYLVTRGLTVDRTRILFGDLDFTKFELAQNKQNGEIVMYQKHPSVPDDVIVIDMYAYTKIAAVLRKIHNITVKPEKAASKTVRRLLIEDDRAKLRAKQEKEHGSQMVLMISSLINCSEFKYGLKEVREMPLYAFMDSLNRVQVVKSASALLQGCYSGMIDTKKINKKELNWMRDYKEK